MVGGLAAWSILAPIEGAVIATGQVVVESSRKTIQHLEGGVVSEILVREGDEVEAGEVLARLEDTVQRANASLVDSKLAELYALRARLEAERDRADVLASPRGADEVLASAILPEKLAGQRELFEARRATRLTQISLLEQRVAQQEERIKGYDAQIASTRGQRTLIEDELAGVRELHEQGFAPKTRLRALEREAERLDGVAGALRADVAEAESVIVEAKLEIERLSETSREEAIAELRDVQSRIGELEEQRATVVDALRRTEVRAPQSGRVIGLQIHTVGGVVAPGASLMEIVPNEDQLQIAARVAPRDVDQITVGQKAVVRLTALGSRRTPELDGAIRHVSADAIADRETGQAYYLVLIDIPDIEAAEARDVAALIPGMPVEAFIRTGSSPAIAYLLKPLLDSFARSMRET
jgi:HlyD family type I secretion membrane fusion protein